MFLKMLEVIFNTKIFFLIITEIKYYIKFFKIIAKKNIF